MHARRIEPVPVEGHVAIGVRQRPFQAFKLQASISSREAISIGSRSDLAGVRSFMHALFVEIRPPQPARAAHLGDHNTVLIGHRDVVKPVTARQADLARDGGQAVAACAGA